MERKHIYSADTRDSWNLITDVKRRSSNLSGTENFIHLILDNTSYTAGERVTGEILLNISEPVSKSILKFFARGIEQISVFNLNDSTFTTTTESQEIFSIDQQMVEWDLAVPLGQYVFPFNFKLPPYCPSSFYYSGEDLNRNCIKAEVFYFISIKILSTENFIILSTSKIIDIKSISVLEKPSPNVETSAVITWCCSSRGRTNFELAVLNRTHCEVDKEVKFKLYPNNSDCTAAIIHVTASIVMELKVMIKNREFRIAKRLCEINRPAWISGNTSLIYDKDFEFACCLTSNSEEQNPSSNKTPLIQCEYYIEIKVFYNIKFLKTPVVITLPFYVCPKATSKFENKLPQPWNPVESSIFSFNIESK